MTFLFSQRRAIIWLTIPRPCLHQFSALFENVCASIGPLDLVANLMPHGFFDHCVREPCDLLGPSPEGCSKAVSRDRTAIGNVDPFLARD